MVRKMVRSSLQSDAKDRGDHLVLRTRPEGTPVQDQSLPHPSTPRKRGRPATGFDKKAHDREKAKERRLKQKAEKS